jgi:hypothetical protein
VYLEVLDLTKFSFQCHNVPKFLLNCVPPCCILCLALMLYCTGGSRESRVNARCTIEPTFAASTCCSTIVLQYYCLVPSTTVRLKYLLVASPTTVQLYQVIGCVAIFTAWRTIKSFGIYVSDLKNTTPTEEWHFEMSLDIRHRLSLHFVHK